MTGGEVLCKARSLPSFQHEIIYKNDTQPPPRRSDQDRSAQEMAAGTRRALAAFRYLIYLLYAIFTAYFLFRYLIPSSVEFNLGG